MRIVVVGASGRTGRHVVDQALERGHRVVAVARRPQVTESDRLAVRATDVLDRAAVTAALDGGDAVVSTLGIGTSRAPTEVYSRGVANILAAMTEHGVRRLSVVSAAPAGPRDRQPFTERRLVMPVLDRFFGATYTDMRAMEAVLAPSPLDWTCLRPPRLVARTPTGRYRVDTDAPPARTRTLTFADLATALLDVLDRPDLYRRCAWIAS